jgi:tetratricopeptide (TPR) repeat protein
LAKRKRALTVPAAARADRPARRGAAAPPRSHPSGSRIAISARRVLALAVIAGSVLVIGFLVLRARRPSAPRSAAAAASPPFSEEQALRAVVAQRPADGGALRALARYFLDAHRPMEALWEFLAVQEANPTDAAGPIGADRALLQAGLPDLARQDLTALVAARSADPAAALALAETLLTMGQPQPAVKVVTAAGPALTRSPEAQLLLGDALAATGDAGGAGTAYRRAVAVAPGDAAAWDRLGRLALAAPDWGAAQQAFAAAREREPANPGYSYRLGLVHVGLGQGEVAEALWESAAQASPRYAPVRLALGKRLRDRKEWSAAAAHLMAAAQADPTLEEAQLALADVMTALGDRAAAFYQRGFADLERDQPHRALEQFRRMIALAPERVDGPLMASLAGIQMQRLDLAAAEARRGLERFPGDARLLSRLAEIDVLGRNYPSAIALCEGWLKRDPRAVEPLRLLAQIARQQQRLSDARRFAEQALANDPTNAAVCDELSQTLVAMPGPANAHRALELAQRATADSPRDAALWRRLGVLLHTDGQPEAAAGALLHALQQDLGEISSVPLLVAIAGQEKRPRTARFFAALVRELEARRRAGKSLWRDVNGRPDDAAVHERLAHFLLSTGDLRRARNQLRQVAALHPVDQAARRDLVVVERLLKLKAE